MASAKKAVKQTKDFFTALIGKKVIARNRHNGQETTLLVADEATAEQFYAQSAKGVIYREAEHAPVAAPVEPAPVAAPVEPAPVAAPVEPEFKIGGAK